MQEVEALIVCAQAARSQAATHMNERSSRSHTLLTAWLTTEAVGSGERCASKLNLVDLAGSERRSAVEGRGVGAARESTAINKSLLALQARLRHLLLP